MKKIALVLTLILTVSQYSGAQNDSFRRHESLRKSKAEVQKRSGERTMQKVSQTQMDCFTAKTLNGNGIVLNYREATINPNVSQQPILVIYLHGASGRGNDNTTQMRQYGIYSIYDYLNNNNKLNAYFAVPQCPKENTWAGGRAETAYVQNIKPLVDYYIKEKGVNPSRIYLFAVSMGGGGAWKMLSDYPNLFAGSLIASGSARNVKPKNVAKTPVYSTIGSLEGEDKAKKIEDFSKQLASFGGDTKFDVLNGLEHGDACVKAFTNDRISWVLSHSKP